MFNEYDVVFASRELSEIVLRGCKGVIVMVFDNQKKVYEVEFLNDDDETLDILTVKEEDIHK
ncbi:DUF4926 domain-containing protein [Paenibacillus sp. S150]|uniref:DUF4926 domain-containing protein n=1 Tax=Paenibacillus sp. S150 TaxID=2749826 RepID=UPI001C559B6A|nr:DUF4926 domain-containing protein [Paenibacillus sp. S150]